MQKPKLVVLSSKDRDALIERIQTTNLPDNDKEILTGLIEFNNWLQFNVQEKSISINRLQNIFGNSSEKGNRKKSKKKSKSNDSSITDISKTEDSVIPDEPSNEQTSEVDTVKNSSKGKNSGRLSHSVYTNADHVTLSPDHKVGEPCPEDCGGKLTTLPPGLVVKIIGQGFAKVTKYKVEKLRCNLCGIQLNAPMPENICDDKYDAAFKSQLCMLKYYMGLPFYRVQGYQDALGAPLPDSTQWDLIDELANDVNPAFKHLEILAATGDLVHADDTMVKILSNIKEQAFRTQSDTKSRNGTFTTGILSYVDDHKIYLFYSSKKHAGENMQQLLSKRPSNLPAIKYMCDALSRNIPKELKTILINCLTHAAASLLKLKISSRQSAIMLLIY